MKRRQFLLFPVGEDAGPGVAHRRAERVEVPDFSAMSTAVSARSRSKEEMVNALPCQGPTKSSSSTASKIRFRTSSSHTLLEGRVPLRKVCLDRVVDSVLGPQG